MPAEETTSTLRDAAIRLAALAQAGLTYSEGDYDLDRYRKTLSSRLTEWN